MLTDAAARAIDREVAKYPPDQKQSAVMAALAIAQDEKGCLSTESDGRSSPSYLGMPPIAVYEVATFYTMYNQRAGRARSSSTSAPTCRARCATAQRRSST